MSAAVSVVIPAFGRSDHLARALESLALALAGRTAEDEVILVDDGGGDLARFARAHLPGCIVLERSENGGFALALADGIAAARNELVFSMNSDLCVQAGFLEPLVRALEEPDVFAAVPRVLRRDTALEGQAEALVESLTRVELEVDGARVSQPGVEAPREAQAGLAGVRPVAFPLGGAALMRRSSFECLGGLDPLFEPFYLEDVDLGWRAWRAGLRCVHVPDATVEHVNQGTIARHAPRALIDDAIAKNQLLFQWKHLDDASLEGHLAGLERRALQAWLCEDRCELERLALALEQVQELFEARAGAPHSEHSFGELARRSDPFAA